ncbi:hypothetical protein ACIQZB_09140 [Streptomyces sp. NPDC097727]|uniref:hypothetical protein n=1 Tax=Streptomyces sp. NPDC097727 TaxID=3366092 RepID=UPI0038131665
MEVYVATPALRGLSLAPRTVENNEVAEITDAAVGRLHPRTWAWRRADHGTYPAADHTVRACRSAQPRHDASCPAREVLDSVVRDSLT